MPGNEVLVDVHNLKSDGKVEGGMFLQGHAVVKVLYVFNITAIFNCHINRTSSVSSMEMAQVTNEQVWCPCRLPST
jgi:hypothetical protein